VRLDVTSRDSVQSGRVSAAILWAVVRVNRDSLRLASKAFDERFGSAAARAAIVGGADPDTVMERAQGAVDSFLVAARRFHIYP